MTRGHGGVEDDGPTGSDARPNGVSFPECALTGLAFAAVMSLAFAPISFWPASLIAIAPLSRLAWRTSHASDPVRWGRGMLGVMLGSAPFWGVQMWWTFDVARLGYPPLILYLTLLPAIYPFVVGLALRGLPSAWWWVGATTSWSLLELLRGRVIFDGFAWFDVGHPLIDVGPTLIWPARYGGAALVSLLAAAIGASIGIGAAQGRWRGYHGATTLALLWVVVGMLVARADEAEPPSDDEAISIGVVQTNVPQDRKTAWTAEDRPRDFAVMIDLTYEAADRGADIIVWPETMFPGIGLDAPVVAELRALRDSLASYADWVLGTESELGVPMIVGATGYDDFVIERTEDGGGRWDSARAHNSVFAISDGTVVARYDKLRLTPFGEIMPYISWSETLENWLLAIAAGGMAFDLTPGEAPVVFNLDVRDHQTRIVTPICFEVTDVGTVRRLLGRGDADERPSLMINLTNDGWFGDWTAGRRQHLAAARWRCVESAVPMARAANTGISAVVDPWGRVIASGVDGLDEPDQVDGVLVARVVPRAARSFYLSGGWLLSWAIGATGLGFLIGTPLHRRCTSAVGSNSGKLPEDAPNGSMESSRTDG